MRTKRANPAFSDARHMVPGGIITYDPSKEGIGERAKGVIKKIGRTSLALVLEDETPVAVARIYSYRPPAPVSLSQSAPSQQKIKRWFIRSDDDEPPKDYASFPF